MTQLLDIPYIDVLDPAFHFASPQISAAREQHWYARTPVGLLILRYQEAADLLADTRLSPTGSGHLALHGITSGPIHRYLGSNMSSTERDNHVKLRAVLAPFLSPRRLAEAKGLARTTAHDLADRLTTDGSPSDLMADFADPLALSLFCHLTGLPADELQPYGSASADVGLVFALSLNTELRHQVEHSLQSLFSYIEQAMAARRATPSGTDLISALMKTGLPTHQQTSFLVSVIMGGHDAPMHQLGCALVALAEHPDQWERLAQDPALIPGAAEESLRWSAHTHTLRFAVEDLEVAGLAMARGDMAAVCNWSANRDPRAFDRPDLFDITRPRGRLPLAFGGGPFFCPGSALGKMVIEVGVEALTQRYTAPATAGPVRWRPALAAAYGPQHLPLVLQER
ncbi:cytochrome P450 [Streptomyces sp. NPDC057909]|uniref:cytochrome P450 n=1 Tax=Streptomyces sp. NPDC057909 TaxID=3346277 RepID=UPI0036EF9C9E